MQRMTCKEKKTLRAGLINCCGEDHERHYQLRHAVSNSYYKSSAQSIIHQAKTGPPGYQVVADHFTVHPYVVNTLSSRIVCLVPSAQQWTVYNLSLGLAQIGQGRFSRSFIFSMKELFYTCG
eukprot:scaffold10864_cov28-Prasinocladus_malaysianus.AAC.1